SALRHRAQQGARRMARLGSIRRRNHPRRVVARRRAWAAPREARVKRRMAGRRVSVALGAMLLALLSGPAAGAHVGPYVPKDNEVSANFKQIKFAIQAKKWDVADRLFESGAVRAEMRAQSSRLPAGLEETTRAALKASDGRGVERALMVFFAALARDLALEADRQLADAREAAVTRMAAGRKFLEAIWRYYNLVDFAVTQYDAKAGVAIRLAFDEAEGYAKEPAVTTRPASASGGSAPDPAKMREPVQRIAQTLSALIETSPTSQRRSS